MTEFSHLLDKFKHMETPAGNNHIKTPPPVNRASRPGPPPLPSRNSKPQLAQMTAETKSKHAQKAGALYEPGHWPTPELPMEPIGPYRILSEGPFMSSTIQAALDQLGPSTTLYLAPRSHWIVTSPIVLQPYQELATFSYPTDESDMASLEAAEECKPYMFACWGKSGIRIRNLLIDGGREKYGWHKDCGVMLSLGHKAINQHVNGCIIRNPRSWSCIQAFEGSHNVRFTNNVIGPAGYPPPEGERKGQWADGISFAGFDGLVAGNLVIDATDGAIVIFGAPGTLITSNTIITRSRSCLGAICMGDFKPHDGNYVYTRVVHNTIISEGAYLKIGIAQGLTTWTSNGDRLINRGGIVFKNLITAPENSSGAMGYGYAVADVTEWTCQENKVDKSVKFQGDISHSMPNPIVSPGPFVRDHTPLHKLGRLQSEFVTGRISYLIGILPGHSTVLSWSPGGFRMKSGDVITIKNLDLVFEGSLSIVDRKHGQRIWELWIEGGSSDGSIVFGEDGKVYFEKKTELKDLLPHLPTVCLDDNPNRDPRANRTETRVILSAISPQFQIAPSPNPSGIILYASSYDIPLGKEFKMGHYVLRPHSSVGDSRVIMYTLSPYGQWVVLLSRVPGSRLGFELKQDKPFHDLIRWGGHARGKVADDRWDVVWTSDNHPANEPVYQPDKGPMLAFQGDGNLVIYFNGAKWASRTHGRKPAPKFVRYRDGSNGGAWIELISEDKSVAWKSN